MVGWHHQPDGHEFEQATGAGDGQGNLVSCRSWGHKESGTTEQLNWSEIVLLNNILKITHIKSEAEITLPVG